MTGGPAGFFTATPRILARAVEGAMNRAEHEHKRAVWSAWTTAALGRVDKMPALDSMMNAGKPAIQRAAQSWESQLASAAAWVAAC